MEKPDLASTIQLDVPAQVKYLGAITACVRAVLERVDCASHNDNARHAIELAVHEACVNIIEHAYAEYTGQISITLTLAKSPCQLEVWLRDTGKAGLIEELDAPAPDELRERGYGLYLMRQLMDSVEFSHKTGTTAGGW